MADRPDPLLEALALRLREVRQLLDAIERDRPAAARRFRAELAQLYPPRRRRWIFATAALAALALLPLALVVMRGDDTTTVAIDEPPVVDDAPVRITAHDDPAPPVRELSPAPSPVIVVPPAPPPRAPDPPADPTADELVQLYMQVGRELQALEVTKGLPATAALWPRYRWIRLADAMSTAPHRRDAYAMLARLRKETESGDHR